MQKFMGTYFAAVCTTDRFFFWAATPTVYLGDPHF